MWCHGGFYRDLKYGDLHGGNMWKSYEKYGNFQTQIMMISMGIWWLEMIWIWKWCIYDEMYWNVAIESGKSWLIIVFWDTLCLDKPYIRYIYIYDNIIGYCLKDFAEATTRMIFARIINNMHFLGMIYTWCTWIAGRILGTTGWDPGPSKPLFHSKHLPRNPLVCPHSNNTSKQ